MHAAAEDPARPGLPGADDRLSRMAPSADDLAAFALGCSGATARRRMSVVVMLVMAIHRLSAVPRATRRAH